MHRAVTITSALLLATSSAAAAPAEIELFDDPFAAISGLVPGRAIVAFGEFHQIIGQGEAPSALTHFGGELLAPLLPHMADLIVETWVTTGRCGQAETSAVEQVQATTQRPEATESEIV